MSRHTLNIFKALADQTRMRIVKTLIEKNDMSCQELMKHFRLSQPTLSYHFGKLLNSGILHARKDGVNHYYSVNKAYLKRLGLDIDTIAKS